MMPAPLLVPEPLQKGDTVAIIAPAGLPRDWKDFETGVSLLQEMGFAVKWPRDLWPGLGFLSDSDSNRAEEIHRMLADPEVKALIALRGGYGCIRLLPHLDFSVFSQFPKPILGFSDITLLLNLVVEKSHLICFHGPVVTSLGALAHESREKLFTSLNGQWKNSSLTADSIEVIRGGTVSGRLIGGNLTTLVSLLGTPYDISWHNSILLLEDIFEPLYRIDRMLTQLFHAGKLTSLQGILLGDFSLGPDQDMLEKLRYTEAIWQRVADLTKTEHIPVWGNFPSGHFAKNMTVPIGAQALMDSDSRSITFFA